MINQFEGKRLVICVNNKGNEASLEPSIAKIFIMQNLNINNPKGDGCTSLGQGPGKGFNNIN